MSCAAHFNLPDEETEALLEESLVQGQQYRAGFSLGLTPKFRLAPLLRGFSVQLTKLGSRHNPGDEVQGDVQNESEDGLCAVFERTLTGVESDPESPYELSDLG